MNKGISPFEQHVEKIAVGVGVLAIAGVLAWQFALTSNTVNVDGEDVAPGEVDGLLKEKASRINSRLGSNVTSPVQFPEITSSGRAAVETALSRGVSPKGQLVPTHPSLGALIAPRGAASDQWYHEPAFASLQMWAPQ